MKILKHKKPLIILSDLLLVPALFLCEKLSDLMLSQYSECPMYRLGGKCVTCGGTHFVNTILNGKITEAFVHNPFLFITTVLLALSLVLLNLYVLFDWKFAKKVLLKIYSISSLIIFVSSMILFFFIRNIPLFINIFKIISQYF